MRAPTYRPLKSRPLAREINLASDDDYPFLKEALGDLEDEGVIEEAEGGGYVLCSTKLQTGEVIGIYSGTRRGFGFCDVREPVGHPQLFITEFDNELGAVTGDVIKVRVIKGDTREAGDLDRGRIVHIVKRAHGRLVGTLDRGRDGWVVLPDGNLFKEPILTPDAAGKYLKPGTKVIVDITTYPATGKPGQGVIAEALGEAGEKDVDLRSILIQYNLPENFPENVAEQARDAVQKFDPETERTKRLDLTNDVICTIDPDDAKDYDDAISLERDSEGNWELGVHIADVSFFVVTGTPLDAEAHHRGNSVYFPGHVVPMLPEVLSNGVCSLQEGVPRLVKSAFITLDARDGKPKRTRFANSIIKSRKRLRYREAQDLIDGKELIRHPEGDRKPEDYAPEVRKLLADMNHVARMMKERRHRAGQLVLALPKVDLVLNEVGKVVDAKPEDDSFTHTLIEMFMVEANEAVGRLFNRINQPAIRRIHPDPDPDASARLGKFLMVAGHKLPNNATRHDLQSLLEKVKGKPEGFAVNLAVLKSLARAEYSPEIIGHYALASDHYCHFTSPIRRYADLTVHRLLDAIFAEMGSSNVRFNEVSDFYDNRKLQDVPSEQDLKTTGQHLSFTERRASDAENELRQMKLLELMSTHVGETFLGVVTGITKIGLFIQIDKWLIEGLQKYQELLNDWWEVDEKAGVVRGKRTNQRIHVGDVAEVRIANVDLARRQLDLHVISLRTRGSKGTPLQQQDDRPAAKGAPKFTPGGVKRSQRSKGRGKGKNQRRDR
jgi:ribonuclease R